MPMKAKSFLQAAAKDGHRSSPQLRGYNSKWNALSASYRSMNPVCECCVEAPSELVHHKIPVPIGPMLDTRNLMAVCKNCHTKLHRELDG